MKTEFECIPCAVNSIVRLFETGVVPEEQKEDLLRKVLSLLSETSYKVSPPVLGKEIHRLIRKDLGNTDPYLEIKKHFNEKLMALLPELEEKIAGAEDKFNAAIRLAIAGNVIDFGAKYQYDIIEALEQLMGKELAIDDSELLREALKEAKTVMYVGDNCGELVMDKLLLEHIDVPKKYFVVRGAPIINDITVDDAAFVNMGEIAEVLTTGDDSPGAVWETSSEEFRQLFNEVDVVISKGQGNLEGLIDVAHRNLYFLLVTKCELIGAHIGTKKGDYVLKKGRSASI